MNRRWSITVLGVFFGILVASPSVTGFDPNENGHVKVTYEALASITRVVEGERLHFSERARGQIIFSNIAEDLRQAQAEVHFDNESFSAATLRLRLWKQDIISKLTGSSSPDGEAARKLLGEALHTLQDFYSHTNWINLSPYGQDIDTRLGVVDYGPGDGQPPTAGAGFEVSTCSTDGDNLSGQGLTWLTSG